MWPGCPACLVGQGGAVQGIAIALPQSLHAPGNETLDLRELRRKSHQRRAGNLLRLPVGPAGNLLGFQLRHGTHPLLDLRLEQPVFFGHPSIFGQERVIVVGSYVRGQLVVVVGAVQQPKACLLYTSRCV